MNKHPDTDPRYHTQKIQTRLNNLIDHLRQDVKHVGDPKAKALFETSAEVLTGLKTAYVHYEEQTEEAWR